MMMDITKNNMDVKGVNAEDNKAVDSFNPDKRKPLESIDDLAKPDKEFNPDKRKTPEVKPNEDGYYTTEKERIDLAPREDSPRGKWTGDPGNSTFIPNDPEIRAKLTEKNQEGINYDHGVVDFSPVAVESVEIDNMTEDRLGPGGNYNQCDEKLAEKFNRERKDGRNDWTAREVADYIEENNLTRHECPDCKTMQLVDKDIHSFFRHSGGCRECKIRDGNKGGDFDA